MIVGSLAEPITELFERGDVRRIGDIVPSGENHAWVDRDEATGADESGPGVAIYEFDTDVPERLVGTSVPSDTDELETILRAAYQ